MRNVLEGVGELAHEPHQFVERARLPVWKTARPIRSRAASTRSVIALPFGVMTAWRTRRSAALSAAGRDRGFPASPPAG